MENNIFTDIWNYLYNVYLAAEPTGQYENLGFEKSPLFSLRLTMLGLFIGIVIAVVVMAYNKIHLGSLVRNIIANGANSAENAKTVEELGIKKGFMTDHALRKNVGIRRFVKCVEEEEFYKEQNQHREKYEAEQTEEKRPKFKEQTYLIDTKTAHFYVPEELRIRAEVRYERKGSGVLATIFTVLGICLIFFLLLLFMPLILDGINDIMGGFGNKG